MAVGGDRGHGELRVPTVKNKITHRAGLQDTKKRGRSRCHREDTRTWGKIPGWRNANMFSLFGGISKKKTKDHVGGVNMEESCLVLKNPSL